MASAVADMTKDLKETEMKFQRGAGLHRSFIISASRYVCRYLTYKGR